ncbi:MAG: CDP-alcohol phosphatidyltransferase family protein [Treponema sp.]|jgi:hypothetical protein|nr:CDP-alcohol phosphatidyltransferase family protein [Treponema sp.]
MALIDGKKVHIKVKETNRCDGKIVRKSRKVTLFGREFDISLKEVIGPMIVRYVGKISDPIYFTNVQEYRCFPIAKDFLVCIVS